jgi:hypothetical protein
VFPHSHLVTGVLLADGHWYRVDGQSFLLQANPGVGTERIRVRLPVLARSTRFAGRVAAIAR